MKLHLLSDLYSTFLRIGGLTFGGGYAMLPMIQREVVESRGWATEEEVMDCYAIGQCTPGVIAVNTATYIGYKKAGVAGGIAATLGVVTPSFLIILLIASALNNFAEIQFVAWALAGVRAGVCALVLKTILDLAHKNIKDLLCLFIFTFTLIAAVFWNISPIFPVILAAAAGILAGSRKGAA